MLTGIAAADDIVSNASDPVGVTTSVSVWAVAVPGEDNGDNNHAGCNIGNVPDALTMTASVTSSDPSVVSVSPGTLTFVACGEANAQTLTLTVAAPECDVVQSATVTIQYLSSTPVNTPLHGVFNMETITVTVAADTSETCGGGGGGGGTTVCSEPAAPAWAAAFLQASNLKSKFSRSTANYVSMVAGHMTNGAVFDGVPKSAQGPGTGDEYPTAVWNYMTNTLGIANLASIASVRLIRPGWTCVVVED